MSSLRYKLRGAAIAAAAAVRLDALARMRRTNKTLVRSIMIHATAATYREGFREQLLWLKEHFELIDFEMFTRLWNDRGAATTGQKRPKLLLTFDDGLLSNYEVAAPLLEESGVRGIFFIVPGFAQLQGSDAHEFFRRQIMGPEELGWQPMTPKHVRELAERGHTIGNHTMTHRRLDEVPQADYQREIIDSAKILEDWTAKSIGAFAWPLHYNAITPAAHRMILSRHRYCFTLAGGITDATTDRPELLWRTQAEPYYSRAMWRFMYSGLSDITWSRKRREVRQLLTLSSSAAAS